LKIEALNSADEQYLVKCCQNNNSQAQKMLYDKYVQSMMVLCLRYIPGPEDAKEVLMDGFCNFFKHIGTFTYQGEGSVKAWLKKILVNQCLMHLRKRQPFFIQAKEISDYESAETDEDVLGQLTAKEILLLVHSLPDGYRAVFNLYVFEGKNHREIGELLGISENTSKSQLHRARALLKEKLFQEAKMNY
jgi:RNA polymerase sigma-70 factor (ECF subfamily)